MRRPGSWPQFACFSRLKLSLIGIVSLALFGLVHRGLATDPISTWTAQSGGVTNYMQNIVYAEGLYVAVGYQGTIITSPDGVEWTTRDSGIQLSLYTITHGGGLFVAAGNQGALTVSEDGMTWTGINSGTFNPLFGSTYGNGLWVVAGGSNILVSANGFQWANRTSPLLPRAYLNAIAFGAGRFVGVGAGGYAVWSTNTFDWVRSDSEVANHFTLIHAGGQFMAAGGGFFGLTAVATSYDGSTWNGQVFGSSVSLVDISYGNGRYLALGLFLTFPPPAGPEFLFESVDGIDWTILDLPTPGAILGLTYANSRFHGVGDEGLVLRSGSYAQACLEVLGPPGTNGLDMRIRGEIGRQYRLQASPDAEGANWQDLLIFTNPIDSDTVVNDPRAGRFPRRFYRAISP